MFWLGIDIGTGGSRALLLDDKGTVVHSYTAVHEEMRMELELVQNEARPWKAAYRRANVVRPGF